MSETTTIKTGWLIDYEDNYFAPRNLFTTVFDKDTGVSLKDTVYKVEQKLSDEEGWKPLLLHYNFDTNLEDTKNLIYYSSKIKANPSNGNLFTEGNIFSNTVIITSPNNIEMESYNYPALMIGGINTDPHIEIDTHRLMAKSDDSTETDLYLNLSSDKVHIGEDTIGGSTTAPIYLNEGIISPITSVGIAYGGTGATTIIDARKNLKTGVGDEINFTSTTEGWYRIAITPSGIMNCIGTFYIEGYHSDKHTICALNASTSYDWSRNLTILDCAHYNQSAITKVRIVQNKTYNDNYAYLDIYVADQTDVYINISGVRRWILQVPLEPLTEEIDTTIYNIKETILLNQVANFSNILSSSCLYLTNAGSIGYGTADPSTLAETETGRVYFKLIDS